jgi:septal ring factor EnvC (AmiA/AmiB activator)
MTNDHFQRQIEFIVNNRVPFTADIQRLKELHKEAEKRMTKIDDVCLRIGNALVNVADRVAEMAAGQTLLESRMADLAKSHEQLAASQEHSDQRLSALIDIVIQERNGKKPS